MTDSLDLVAIVGSLRAGSLSRIVFNAASELVRPEATLTEVDVRKLPFYDGDVEAEGDPSTVSALKQSVIEADGLIIFTPEYNLSVPALTKNAIDWLSRVPGESALTNASVGIIAATPGRHDAAGVRRHLSDSLSRIAGHFFPTTLGISGVTRKTTDGRLSDPETLDALADWLAAFVENIRTRPPE